VQILAIFVIAYGQSQHTHTHTHTDMMCVISNTRIAMIVTKQKKTIKLNKNTCRQH